MRQLTFLSAASVITLISRIGPCAPFGKENSQKDYGTAYT